MNVGDIVRIKNTNDQFAWLTGVVTRISNGFVWVRFEHVYGLLDFPFSETYVERIK